MKTLGALLVTGFLLSGCAALEQQRQQEVFRQHDAIKEQCRQKHVLGELKTYAERARCGEDRIRRLYAENNFPHMDWLNLMHAYEVALSERVDKGELSLAEANVQMAELGIRFVNEAKRRDEEAHQTQLQSQQARQQAWQDALRMLNDNLQRQQDRDALMTPRPMAPITCQQFGTMIQCR